MRERVIKPEILDSLPQGHPDAEKNRRDIYLLGRLSGNYARAASLLLEHQRPGDRILEIGAGGGELGQVISKQLKGIPESIDYTGLDLWTRPDDWPQQWGWSQADLLDYAGYGDYNVLIGNFILHQFEDAPLRALFERIRHSFRLMIFCETARHPWHLWQLRLAYLLGINYVTRHDGKVSIEAGFKPGELAPLLGLDDGSWHVQDGSTFMGCYWLVAERQV
ncbi:MAG: hypothetical protein AAGF10_00475 [Verrucomicrobiota bacterium]